MDRSKVCLVLVVVLAAYSLLMIIPVNAQVENVSTSCGIFVNNIVFEGHPVTVTVQIFPAPPSGEVFNNLTIWMTSPMQGVWGNGGNGPWSKGDVFTDSNGKATVTFDIVTFSGYWNIELNFEGQYFANNTIYYQPGNWQIGFTVYPVQTSTPSPTHEITQSPTPAVTITPIPTLPNNGPTSAPNTNPDLTVTLTWIIIAIFVISVISLLLYNRNLKKRRSKLDNSKLVVICTKSTIQPNP
jgi:hypothetical protein